MARKNKAQNIYFSDLTILERLETYLKKTYNGFHRAKSMVVQLAVKEFLDKHEND